MFQRQTYFVLLSLSVGATLASGAGRDDPPNKTVSGLQPGSSPPPTSFTAYLQQEISDRNKHAFLVGNNVCVPMIAAHTTLGGPQKMNLRVSFLCLFVPLKNICELNTEQYLQLDCQSDGHWDYASIFAVKVRFQTRDQFWIPQPKLHG